MLTKLKMSVCVEKGRRDLIKLQGLIRELGFDDEDQSN